jgi:hypothetical protein
MVRNKMPDFENQECGRKCEGELLVFIIPPRLSGSWIFCKKIGFWHRELSIFRASSHMAARVFLRKI